MVQSWAEEAADNAANGLGGYDRKLHFLLTAVLHAAQNKSPARLQFVAG